MFLKNLNVPEACVTKKKVHFGSRTWGKFLRKWARNGIKQFCAHLHNVERDLCKSGAVKKNKCLHGKRKKSICCIAANYLLCIL